MKRVLASIFLFFTITFSLFSQCTPGNGNWLTTNGNQLLDSNGNVVNLSGINWFGFETNLNFPHGIWGDTRDFKSVLQQIKDLGFNSMRVPWHNRMLEDGADLNVVFGGIDPVSGVNPMNEIESTFTQPIQLLDALVQWCQDNDMKIILDCHSRNPDAFIEETFWYTSDFTEQQWIDDWVFLADRYKNFDAVIGMDINNEPHGTISDSQGARWGSGNPLNDWRLAAQACGNAILDVNPNVLIIVEGIEAYQRPDGTNTSYWWGGNLQGVRDFPIVLSDPSKLVYSPHEYGPEVFDQTWFSDPNFPNNLDALWEENYNFINTNNIAPLLVGEFGIRDQGGAGEQWFSRFVNYIEANNLNYTYWCFNPNSGDTGGIIADDWNTVNQWKLDYLQPILYDPIPNCNATLSSDEFDVNDLERVELYPNPVKERLTINAPSAMESFAVYDLNGRLLETVTVENGVSKQDYNINKLSVGVYIIQVQIDNRNYVSRFIKQ